MKSDKAAKLFGTRITGSSRLHLAGLEDRIRGRSNTPDAVSGAIKDQGAILSQSLEGEANALAEGLHREAGGDLVDLWAAANDALELLILVCSGVRALSLPEHRPSSLRVIRRLHGRAITGAWEVLALLRGGLPSGAMARWRSTYELAVTAIFIEQASEEAALAFERHEAFRRYKYAKAMRAHGAAWGADPLPDDLFAEVERQFRDAKASASGRSFDSDYGWAEPYVSRTGGRATFQDLEQAVGGERWRIQYAAASESVHVGDHGARPDDHVYDNPYLARRLTSYAHGEAGAWTALSVGGCTEALLRLAQTADDPRTGLWVELLVAAIENQRRRVDDRFTETRLTLLARGGHRPPNRTH